MTNLMSNDQHFMPSTMASHTSMPSPRSQDSMGQAIDLPLNYDAPRFYMNFQSPSVSAAMLRQGQVTPPMQDLGDPTEDDFGLDCSLYSPAVSTSRGQLTPPMSISDLDGYTEQDFMTLDCNLPVGMTSSNGKFYLQEKRRMQNREAQRRFRARNQKHIKGLQKELNDLRSENRKLLEEHEQKVEEISRLQEKINDMNREMKETKESKETETKLDCDAPARCQCWTRNGTLARFRPTEILCTTRRTSGPGSPENTAKEEDCRSGYSVLMELVPADHRHSDKSYESFRKRLESQAGEESEDTSETTERTTNSEPEGKYFLLSPLSVH